MTLMRSAGSSPAGSYDPGAALARREARVALDLLIGRLPGLRLTDQPERTDSFMMWGPKSLRVAWDVPVPGGDS